MTRKRLTRRRLLLATGTAVSAGVAGCSSGAETAPSTTQRATSGTRSPTTSTPAETRTQTETGDAGPKNANDLPEDPAPTDGYPPEFDPAPEKVAFDASSFERVERDGVRVPLIPLEIAYNWYARRAARFVDARSQPEYAAAHVYGAVLSPAPDGRKARDPTTRWPKTDRVVCYCSCPHHLSSMRAASFAKQGYEDVFAIDEGFVAWRHRDYPVVGNDVGHTPTVRTIVGRTGPSFAGETAWAIHEPSGQREASEIRQDGRYRIDLRFVNLTDGSKVTVETPGYTVTESLGTLTESTIEADGSLSARTGTTTSRTTT